MAKSVKLHELLAVDSNLKGQADKTRGELSHTFEKKPHLFGKKLIVSKPIAEGIETVEEQSDLQTTVRKELAWIGGIMANALDVSYQVALGNTTAKADIVLEDGTPLASNVPVTSLLELEKRAAEIKALVVSIKTLDPAKGFTLDASEGKAIYKARTAVSVRTKKTQRPIVLYDATKEHPAQVQLLSEDLPVANVTTYEWSGLITPNEKGDLLDRCENLERAIKQARARANETTVDTGNKIGGQLLEYVFGKTA